MIWFLCNCGTGVNLLTIAGIIAIFISGMWPLAVAWLICKVIIWICSAMGIDETDLHAIAIVTVFDVLLVFVLCTTPLVYEGDGAMIAFVSFFAVVFIFGLTVVDVNLIKEAWERKQKNEREKSEENQDVH